MLSTLAAAEAAPKAFPASAQYVTKMKEGECQSDDEHEGDCAATDADVVQAGQWASVNPVPRKKKGKGKKVKNGKNVTHVKNEHHQVVQKDEPEGSHPSCLQPQQADKNHPKPSSLAAPAIPATSLNSEPEDAKPKDAKPKKANQFGAYQAGKYCCARDNFLEQMQRAFKLSFKRANELWKSSHARKLMLQDVLLPELKRRRFVEKTATTNPFTVEP